ncbi:MAG: hypothetical protein ACAI35_04030 [Candidatus Methylacidiphilales bacterium]|nr:hypothetical protein [Candidatus Methylacidiphilales bacterium]
MNPSDPYPYTTPDPENQEQPPYQPEADNAGGLLRYVVPALFVIVPLLILLGSAAAVITMLNDKFSDTYVVAGNVSVNSMAWNAEGKRLAVSLSTGDVDFVDWPTGSVPNVGETLPWFDKMSRLQWSPDGEWIAGITTEGTSSPRPVTLHLKTGIRYEPFGNTGEPEGQTKVFAWAPPPLQPNRQTQTPPRIVVAGMSDLFIQSPRTSEPSTNWRFPAYQKTEPGIDGPGSRGLPHQASCLTMIPDPANPGSTLARMVTMREEESITVQDRPLYPATEEKKNLVRVFTKPIQLYSRFDVLLSPDGGTLAAFGYDLTDLIHIDLWQISSGGKLRTLLLDKAQAPGLELELMWRSGQSLHQVAWSRDGKRIAGAFRLNDVRKQFVGILLAWWDVDTGNLVATKWAWKLDSTTSYKIPFQRPRGIGMSFGEISWSPDLDKVALLRPMSLSTPDERTAWQRQMVVIVPAPPEAGTGGGASSTAPASTPVPAPAR